MKFNLPAVLSVLAVALLSTGADATAQELKIAVVDMQSALNDYYKTDVEVKKINDLAEEKRKNLDERQAAYQQMTNQLAELDKTMRDTSIAEKLREETYTKMQTLAQERAAKGKEIADAQRKAQSEVMEARTEMEATLVKEIKDSVYAIVQAKGFDLVFDKSFLPKANKAILYTSGNVPDVTAEVVSTLNAGAPASGASE